MRLNRSPGCTVTKVFSPNLSLYLPIRPFNFFGLLGALFSLGWFLLLLNVTVSLCFLFTSLSAPSIFFCFLGAHLAGFFSSPRSRLLCASIGRYCGCWKKDQWIIPAKGRRKKIGVVKCVSSFKFFHPSSERVAVDRLPWYFPKHGLQCCRPITKVSDDATGDEILQYVTIQIQWLAEFMLNCESLQHS